MNRRQPPDSCQVFGNHLHSRHADETLGREVAIDDLAFLQLDDPAIPGTHDALVLPRGNDVPEQGMIYGEELGTVIKLEFASAKATNAPAGKYALLEDGKTLNQAL